MSRIIVKWDIGGFGPEKHYIYRSDSEISPNNLPSPIAEVGPGVNEYIDYDGIVEGGRYYYFVAAEKKGLLVPAEVSVEVYAVPFTHDIFGDGSAIATYQLDGDVVDHGGNFDAVNIDGEFQGIGLRLNNDQGYSRLNTPILDRSVASVSMIIKTSGLSGRAYTHIADFRLGNGSGYYTLNASGSYNGGGTTSFHLNGSVSNGAIPYNQELAHVYFELSVPSNAITFGNRYTSSSNIGSINSEVANIRLFDRPLTSSEITHLTTMDTTYYV